MLEFGNCSNAESQENLISSGRLPSTLFMFPAIQIHLHPLFVMLTLLKLRMLRHAGRARRYNTPMKIVRFSVSTPSCFFAMTYSQWTSSIVRYSAQMSTNQFTFAKTIQYSKYFPPIYYPGGRSVNVPLRDSILCAFDAQFLVCLIDTLLRN